MKIIILSVMVLILVSCSPSEESIRVAIEQTQNAIPTNTAAPSATPFPTIIPTATLVPLEFLDLESFVIKDGDLPAGYSAAQVRTELPEMFDEIPEPLNTLYQQFEHENNPAGGVGIIIYGERFNADTAYYVIQTGMGSDFANPFDGLGERARVSGASLSVAGYTIKLVEVLFLRCTTVIHIRISDTDNIDYGTAYAQRLDERLSPYICPTTP